MAPTTRGTRATSRLGAWLAIVCFSGLGLTACGTRAATADAGADAQPTVGLRAFDVVASLTSPGDAGVASSQFPPTNRFTLVLDTDGRRLIAGGQGTGAVVPVTSSGGRTFRTTRAFDTATPPLGTCGDSSRITYQMLELTVAGATLTGHATGSVAISCGDCQFSQPFVAELAGGADTTPPTLVSAPRQADPFDDFTLLTSEPLPVGATARVVDADGVAVALEPVVQAGDASGAPAVVVGFTKTMRVLGVGGGYAVELGGLVDFAGLRGPSATPLRLGSFTPPPLVPGDGFESATGTSVGGALLVKAGSDLAPLAGTQSLYLGRPDAPLVTKLGAGPRLMVRLAVPAGATKLVYTARIVAPSTESGFAGQVSVGSVGKTPTIDAAADRPNTETPMTLASGDMIVLSDVKHREIALPADVTDEIVVEIAAFDGGCGLFSPPAGLLVDDLRVE